MDRVGTLHNLRFVFLENDTKMLFATAYDGDWDDYINDFATKIPAYMDLLFSAVPGWPGIHDPSVKDFIASIQVPASRWYVAVLISPSSKPAGSSVWARPWTSSWTRSAQSKSYSPPERWYVRRPGASGVSGASIRMTEKGEVACPTWIVVASSYRVGSSRSSSTKSRPRCSGLGLNHTLEPTSFWVSMMPPQAVHFFEISSHMLRPPRIWWCTSDAWTSVALTYAGLEALGVPQYSLRSFPEPFRQGMAARAARLGDVDVNDPEHWEQPFGTGEIHLGVSIFSDSVPKWHKTRDFRGAAASEPPRCHGALRGGIPGRNRATVTPSDSRISLASRPSKAAESLRCPDRADRSRRASSSWGIPARPERTFLCHDRTCSDATEPSWDPQVPAQVGAFNRFLRDHAEASEERRLPAAKLVGRWRSGAPLTLVPECDEPTLGADPQRNNDFTYADDAHGRCVPFGAHMRRLNPRDTDLPVLTDVNLHRIIRRGTTYGAPYDPEATSTGDDEVPRGISLSSSMPTRWAHSSSCSVNGSRTATLRARATNETRWSGCNKKMPPSRFRRNRSGAACRGSRPSTCYVVVSISSCPDCQP